MLGLHGALMSGRTARQARHDLRFQVADDQLGLPGPHAINDSTAIEPVERATAPWRGVCAYPAHLCGFVLLQAGGAQTVVIFRANLRAVPVGEGGLAAPTPGQGQLACERL